MVLFAYLYNTGQQSIFRLDSDWQLRTVCGPSPLWKHDTLQGRVWEVALRYKTPWQICFYSFAYDFACFWISDNQVSVPASHDERSSDRPRLNSVERIAEQWHLPPLTTPGFFKLCHIFRTIIIVHCLAILLIKLFSQSKIMIPDKAAASKCPLYLLRLCFGRVNAKFTAVFHVYFHLLGFRIHIILYFYLYVNDILSYKRLSFLQCGELLRTP